MAREDGATLWQSVGNCSTVLTPETRSYHGFISYSLASRHNLFSELSLRKQHTNKAPQTAVDPPGTQKRGLSVQLSAYV